ncbi:mitochondrial mRNA pseudouridine synthase Trub2-like [Bradysia coprophila]|uniref:mitochondrial mRNA pseudouridine synthase Trub2-like n=1 Tax=Bradysia coprophila TaxID=38358 RepID=UPI00187DD573|nr:mitochondrial mRNA pseudouridine synthase Trub2-like [Bradysia coprophila]
MQNSMLAHIKDANTVWNTLNGIINVYKPAGVSVNNIKRSLLGNLCKGLNSLQTRPPIERVVISDAPHDRYKVDVATDWSDHVLAVGERHQISDFKFNTSHLSRLTSGVLLVGLNAGTQQIHRIRDSRLIRVYHVTGELGTSTENNFKDSLVIARANYTHVWPDKMNAILSSMQASHQRKMFELCGVHIQSNSAFEIAKRGLIRPASQTVPILYGMKCVQFDRPKFTIEVHAINEHVKYFGELIQEIGLQLHSVACCTGVRCIRHGHFTNKDSLLRSNWHLQEVVTNMAQCRQIIDEHPNMLRQENVELTEKEQEPQ